jgi:hypothetical protein
VPALLTLHTALDEGTFGCGCRQALVDQLDGQAGCLAYGRRQLSRGGCLGPMSAVEPQREPDDDPRRLIRPRQCGESRRQGLLGVGWDGGQRLRYGPAGIAQGETDALRPRIDRQDSQIYGDGAGLGVGLEGAVDGGGAFDSTT